MSMAQMVLSIENVVEGLDNKSYRGKLVELLTGDLDFHDQDSSYASHDFHSFPAKFPPQLPYKFINGLTQPGDTVLDPMLGSGTTILEAFLCGRYAIGFDIDPLALLISQVKVSSLDPAQLKQIGDRLIQRASLMVKTSQGELRRQLSTRWDIKTQKFVDYWFAPNTQLELMALITEIEKIEDKAIKAFFELAFSAIIITKSGGISLAFDLGHTRPHKAKVVRLPTGEILSGQEWADDTSPRIKFLTKTLRSPLVEFEKRYKQNLKNIVLSKIDLIPPAIKPGNAQDLWLPNETVDLIVTSPPYASNAIDYMRAHKFSLVWLGYAIDDLSQKRQTYIGGDSINGTKFEEVPDYTAKIVSEIVKLDKNKGIVLHRYYSEITRTLREMYRVLRPGKTAIVVVGSSVMRGRDTETHTCLADIGAYLGFEVPKIGVRHLDRDRRMLPAGLKVNLNSQIQQRMHEEYVIGFYKPEFRR